MKLQDIYLFSDIDGTLYSLDTDIIQENIRAVTRFMEAGGNFALATGRGVKRARTIAEKLKVNTACIVNNGAAIYDYNKEGYLYEIYLPKNAESYLAEIMKEYPNVSPAAICHEGGYIFSYIDDELVILRDEGKSIAEILRTAFRIVFTVPEDMCSEILEFMNSRGYPDVDFTSSDTFYIDMIAKGNSKGSALKRFCKVKGIDIEQTAAIGDYYNDLELLQTAHYSCAVNSAPEDIKAAVKYISCDFADGAVADFIKYLEEMCE